MVMVYINSNNLIIIAISMVVLNMLGFYLAFKYIQFVQFIKENKLQNIYNEWIDKNKNL
jgi:hypothetical protein